MQVVPDAQKPDTLQNSEDPQNPGETESIDQHESLPALHLSPNPSCGLTTLSCSEPISELTLCDMAGRIIMHKAASGTRATIDTSTMRKGVYLVKVRTASGTKSCKIVVGASH